MLRNNYLESYKTHKRNISEFEKEMLLNNEEHQLYLQRPLSSSQIKSIKSKKLHNFIDDIMCNKQINNLLYSANAKKEISFYLNQSKNFKVSNKDKKENSKNEKSAKNFVKTEKKRKLFQSIKTNLKIYKLLKNKSMKELSTKNKKFIFGQPPIDKKLKKIFYKPVNENLIKGYQKAFKTCLIRSSERKFKLPNSELNMENVYSRLYHNVINTKNNISSYKTKNNNSVIVEKNIHENFTEKSHSLNHSTFSEKPKKKFRRNSTIVQRTLFRTKEKNSKNNSTTDLHIYYKKDKIFTIKNTLKNSDGRQFVIRITPNIKNKCWKLFSGGPKTKSENNSISLKKNNIYSDNIFRFDNENTKNDLILFNTLIYEDENMENEIVKIENYHDTYNNSNMHIAVIKNSEKLVKYFIGKNYNLNEKNKNGKTPLHIALENNNFNIIRLLVNNGANLKIPDNDGITPYDLASSELKNILQLDDKLVNSRYIDHN